MAGRGNVLKNETRGRKEARRSAGKGRMVNSMDDPPGGDPEEPSATSLVYSNI